MLVTVGVLFLFVIFKIRKSKKITKTKTLKHFVKVNLNIKRIVG